MPVDVRPHESWCSVGIESKRFNDNTEYICSHPGEEITMYECSECGKIFYACDDCNMVFFKEKENVLFSRLEEVAYS